MAVARKWYQKPTDTGTILNIRSSAPLQHKKIIAEGTTQEFFDLQATGKTLTQHKKSTATAIYGEKINIRKFRCQALLIRQLEKF